MGSPGLGLRFRKQGMLEQVEALLMDGLNRAALFYPQAQPPEPHPPPDGFVSSPPQPQLPPAGAPLGKPSTKPSPRSSLMKPSSAPSSFLEVPSSTNSFAPFFSTMMSPSPA